jgi:hypothetical protein
MIQEQGLLDKIVAYNEQLLVQGGLFSFNIDYLTVKTAAPKERNF